LEESINVFLPFFCHSSVETLQLITDNQSAIALFANVLHFIYTFDELKMVNPNLQNDFSFYRRSLPKIKVFYDQISHYK
jgi:hypothetical protein